MRRWLEDGFREWGRAFFTLGVFTMLVGAFHMMFAHADLGAFSVKAGAIECMMTLAWGWLVRRNEGAADGYNGNRSRRFVSRDRARRAVRENFPEDADEILSDIDL